MKDLKVYYMKERILLYTFPELKNKNILSFKKATFELKNFQKNKYLYKR